MEDSQQQKTEATSLEELKKRKEELLNKVKQKKKWLIYALVLAIAWIGYHIRTKNIPLLQGKWLPDVDSYAFLRYAEYIAAHGKMMIFDSLRYYPFGFYPQYEFGFLSYTIAGLYKVLHIFNPNATVVDGAILYPPLAFVGAIIFFYLFVKKMFNYKVALVSAAFLTVIPPFLYRTMAGVADKEALAMLFMFGALYFFASAIKSGSARNALINGLLGGIFTGLTGAVWGGVQFLFLTLGIYMLVCSLLNIIDYKKFYAYVCWLVSMMLTGYILYPTRYNLSSFYSSFTTQVALVGLLVPLVSIVLSHPKLKPITEKIETKIPLNIFSLLVVVCLGGIALTVSMGTGTIGGIIHNVYGDLTNTLGDRWSLTVAENHQPYFADWISQMSWKYLLLFMCGAVLLFYEMVKRLKKPVALKMTILFAALIIAVSMNRYSESSTFNGQNAISILVYIGSMLAFAGIIIYGYVKAHYKDKMLFDEIKTIDSGIILMLVWLVIMLVAARTAIRLLFVFAPVTTIFVGYLTVRGIEISKGLKKDVYKIIGYVLIAIVIGTTLLGFYNTVNAQASYVGLSYNIQWQNAMSWVRENTPSDSIFAHWWDYGYWVQWGGQRATISDGGNAFDGINHFVGRHVLTAQSEQEALEFLKARNVSYLLIIKEEIGKYPAFSSIGADSKYDRYSWISTFVLRADQTRETRNETIYLYVGGTPLDDDFVYNNKLYPAGSAGIGAFMLPLQNVEISEGNGTKTVQKLGQPKAILVYNGMQAEVPIKCVYLNGQEITFEGNNLEGCLRIMPTIEADGKMNPIGSALYLSPDVYKGLFAKLFLLNHESQYFKLGYSDEETGMPLALYQGQLIGPLKIWKVSYPDNLTIPPEYYKNEVPDMSVKEVKR